MTKNKKLLFVLIIFFIFQFSLSLSYMGRDKDAEIKDKKTEEFEYELDYAKTMYGNEHPRTAEALINLGRSYYFNGKMEKAILLFEEALAMEKKIFGSERPDVAECFNNLGDVWFAKKQYEKALTYYERGLDVSEKVYGRMDLKLTRSLNGIGVSLFSLTQYKEALPFFEKALETEKQAFGQYEANKQVAISLRYIAAIYGKIENKEKAIETYETAVENYKAAFGYKDTEIVSIIVEFADYLYSVEKNPEALELYEEALLIAKSLYTLNDCRTTEILEKIASTNISIKNYDKAYWLYTQALEINKKLYGTMHPSIVTDLVGLGTLAIKKKEYRKAKQFFENAEKAALTAYIKTPEKMAEFQCKYGDLFFEVKDYDNALKHYQDALAIAKKVSNGKPTLEIYDYNTKIMNIAYILKKYVDALNLCTENIALIKEKMGDNNRKQLKNYNDMILIWKRLNNKEKIIECYFNALSIETSIYSEISSFVAYRHNLISIFYKEAEDYENALKHIQKSIEIEELLKEGNSSDINFLASYYNNYGLIFESILKYKEAIEQYEKALVLLNKYPSKSNPKMVAQIQNNLEDAKQAIPESFMKKVFKDI